MDERGVARHRVGRGGQALELMLIARGGTKPPEEAAHAEGARVPALRVTATAQQGSGRLEDADDLAVDALRTQGAAEGEVAVGHALAVDDRDAAPAELAGARQSTGEGKGLAQTLALVAVDPVLHQLGIVVSQRGLGTDGHQQVGRAGAIGEVRVGEEAPISQQLGGQLRIDGVGKLRHPGQSMWWSPLPVAWPSVPKSPAAGPGPPGRMARSSVRPSVSDTLSWTSKQETMTA